MKQIKLTKNTFTIIDDEDYELLKRLEWKIDKDGYVVAHLKLARLIMHTPKNKVVDHIDGNPLNNQKSNLRNCTRAENMRNSHNNKLGKTSKYRGVCIINLANLRCATT